MPVDADIAVVHVDAFLIVVDKPAGLPSVPGRGAHLQDCAAARVQARHADARVVHRLDMATSGLLLFARGAEMQRFLSRSFAERRVGKRYVAIVAGRPLADVGEIDLPLSADWPHRPRQRVDVEHGKPSLTRYRVSAHDPVGGTSRIELEPVSGRSHQLRVHLLALGHPILGDALYAPANVLAMAGRLMLHAQRLVLTHPATGVRVELESPPPF